MLFRSWRSYGVSAEIAAVIQERAFDFLDAPIARIATAEVPMPYAKPLEQAALPHAQAVVETARSMVSRRRGG